MSSFSRNSMGRTNVPAKPLPPNAIIVKGTSSGSGTSGSPVVSGVGRMKVLIRTDSIGGGVGSLTTGTTASYKKSPSQSLSQQPQPPQKPPLVQIAKPLQTKQLHSPAIPQPKQIPTPSAQNAVPQPLQPSTKLLQITKPASIVTPQPPQPQPQQQGLQIQPPQIKQKPQQLQQLQQVYVPSGSSEPVQKLPTRHPKLPNGKGISLFNPPPSVVVPNSNVNTVLKVQGIIPPVNSTSSASEVQLISRLVPSTSSISPAPATTSNTTTTDSTSNSVEESPSRKRSYFDDEDDDMDQLLSAMEVNLQPSQSFSKPPTKAIAVIRPITPKRAQSNSSSSVKSPILRSPVKNEFVDMDLNHQSTVPQPNQVNNQQALKKLEDDKKAAEAEVNKLKQALESLEYEKKTLICENSTLKTNRDKLSKKLLAQEEKERQEKEKAKEQKAKEIEEQEKSKGNTKTSTGKRKREKEEDLLISLTNNSQNNNEMLIRKILHSENGILSIIQAKSMRDEEEILLRKFSAELVSCMTAIVEGEKSSALLCILEDFVCAHISNPNLAEIVKNSFAVIYTLINSGEDCRQLALHIDEMDSERKPLSRTSSDVSEQFVPHPNVSNARILTTPRSLSQIDRFNDKLNLDIILESQTYFAVSARKKSVLLKSIIESIPVIIESQRTDLLEVVLSIVHSLAIACPSHLLFDRFNAFLTPNARVLLLLLKPGADFLVINGLAIDILTELLRDKKLLEKIKENRLIDATSKFLGVRIPGATHEQIREARKKSVRFVTQVQALHEDGLEILLSEEGPVTHGTPGDKASRLVSRMVLLLSFELDSMSTTAAAESHLLISAIMHFLMLVCQDGPPPDLRVSRHLAISVFVRLEACKIYPALKELADQAEYLRNSLPLS